HPSNALGDLDVGLSRHGVRVVISRALDVDDAGQHPVVDVEEAGPTIRAEMPPAVFRGIVNLRCTPGYLDGIAPVHCPADHRCAGAAPTIAAMAECVRQRLAFRFVSNSAAMAAAGDGHLSALLHRVAQRSAAAYESYRRLATHRQTRRRLA